MEKLTISQIGDALQVLLERKIEGLMTPSQLNDLAEKLSKKMLRTQERNRKASESHRRRRIKELGEQDIRCSELKRCDSAQVAL